MPQLFDRFPALDPSAINASELAAIVVDDGAAVDHLLAFFAGELTASGFRLGGLIHQPDDDEQPSPDVTLIDLLSGEHWQRRRHHPDILELAASTRRIMGSIEGQADLCIIPRFGEAEMAGSGHVEAFGTIAAFGIPILTVVGRDMVEPWLTFTGGIGTLLACRLRVVRAWWQDTDTRRRKMLARAVAGSVTGAEVVRLLPSFD
jgi:molybdate transport system ATP-binding protein